MASYIELACVRGHEEGGLPHDVPGVDENSWNKKITGTLNDTFGWKLKSLLKDNS